MKIINFDIKSQSNMMTSDERNAFKRWIMGIPYEVNFWNSYYKHPKSLAKLFSWSEYDNECRLDEFDVQQYMEQCGDNPVMVDIGCALSYVLGTKFRKPGVILDLVDPLAHFYNRILDDVKINRQRIKFGMIETLSTIYKAGSVDLVHVRNALDHCSNPMLGIFESLLCLRIGGVLYLHHHQNEAVREKYRGFHQYNVDCVDGRLVIWRGSRGGVDIALILSGIANVECSLTSSGYVVAVIRKTAEVPEEVYSRYTAIERSAEMLALYQDYFHSSAFSLRYNVDKMISSVAHPLMRRIPRPFVERLKR